MTQAQENVQTYPLKEQKMEMARLFNQHELIKDAMGGLLLVPVNLSTGSKRILDSRTADGTWIRDLKNTVAGSAHTFVGTDIDDSKFPEIPEDNISYHFQNITEPWPSSWNQSFDIVHQRLVLVGAGPNAKGAVKRLTRLVKPRGWIQLIEGDNFPTDKGGPMMREFITLLRDLFVSWEANPTLARELAGMLREEGFVDIEERVFTPEFGAANKNERLKENGTYSMKTVAGSMIEIAKSQIKKSEMGNSKKLFFLTNGEERLDSLLANLETELGDETISDGFPLRAVWGRRP